MTNLGQLKYKDANGIDIDAGLIGALAPYRHIADGFYAWTCGRCGTENGGRACGWPISGQVLQCKCHIFNLLVRTNCVEIDEALQGKWRTPERDKELERLKGVVEINDQKVVEIKHQIQTLVRLAVANWRLSIEDQKEPSDE